MHQVGDLRGGRASPERCGRLARVSLWPLLARTRTAPAAAGSHAYRSGRCWLAHLPLRPLHAPPPCSGPARESLGAESDRTSRLLSSRPYTCGRGSTFVSAPRVWASGSGPRGSLLGSGAVCSPGGLRLRRQASRPGRQLRGDSSPNVSSFPRSLVPLTDEEAARSPMATLWGHGIDPPTLDRCLWGG